jgi:hypothetical protein
MLLCVLDSLRIVLNPCRFGATRCSNQKCTCHRFFFIVAEGSWILRCRCKHKHVEHNPVTHACAKSKCACSKFSSPWVCNCDHPWTDHQQREVRVQVSIPANLMHAAVTPQFVTARSCRFPRWKT